jgi:BON domain
MVVVVSGVRTVAHDLTVKVLSEHVRSDSDIASSVQRTLEWDVLVPKAVTAVVRDGWVTFEGQVDWISSARRQNVQSVT